MKKTLRFKACIFMAFAVSGQLFYAQNFTWKKGVNTVNQNGSYGTMGVAATSNAPGGRYGAGAWKDLSGNFWMFGGEGKDLLTTNIGYLCDLWKYEPATNNWTWMKGDDFIAQISNYGTLGVPSATNKPGGRISPACWRDASGDLWMFGGHGYDNTPGQAYLNDLWKYSMSTNQWTWMGGSNSGWQSGSYGTQGVPSATNIPSARAGAVTWVDALGDFWLFGGKGMSTNTVNVGYLNDLWKYNPTTGQWTWVSGSNQLDQNGSYGTLGTSAPSNIPGGRMYSSGWMDNIGNIWLFGGEGMDASSTNANYLNDLWKYNVPLNEWTWVHGSNTADQLGKYGIQGVASATNAPGGRYAAISWTDGSNNMFLFSGEGFPGTGTTTGNLNDLWKYDISSNQWMWVRGASINNQFGSYGSQGFPSITNIPGARYSSVSWIDSSDNLWLFGGDGKASTGPDGFLADLWKYTNCFVGVITPSIVSADSSLCLGEATSLTASGANNYLWSEGSITTPTLVITPTVTTTYTVTSSNSNGCLFTATFTEFVDACLGIKSEMKDEFLKIYPNPSKNEFFIKKSGSQTNQLLIYNTAGVIVLERSLNNENERIEHQLPRGLYFYSLIDGNKVVTTGKLAVD